MWLYLTEDIKLLNENFIKFVFLNFKFSLKLKIKMIKEIYFDKMIVNKYLNSCNRFMNPTSNLKYIRKFNLFFIFSMKMVKWQNLP